MAQKRMLDKKVSVSEQIANLSSKATIVFFHVLPHCDDAGLIPFAARAIKGLAVPLRDDITTVDVADCMNEMIHQKIVEVVDIEDSQYYRFVKFWRNQTLKKDRQPQLIFDFLYEKTPQKSWQKLLKMFDEENGSTKPQNTSGFQLEDNVSKINLKLREEKRREEKLREENILAQAQVSSNQEKETTPPTERIDQPIVRVIEMFKVINENYTFFFRHKTQRKAIEEILQKHDEQVIEKYIYLAKFSINNQFFPNFISPYEMQMKWPKIEKFWRTKQVNDKRYLQDFDRWYAEIVRKRNEGKEKVVINTEIAGKKITYEFNK